MSVRDLTRDPRVAAATVVAAALLVGYRVHQGASGPALASPAAASVAAPEVEEHAGHAGPAAGGGRGRGTPPVSTFTPIVMGAASPGRGAPRTSREPAWSWDRNPFLPAARMDLPPPGVHGPSSGEAEARGAARLDLQAALRGTVVSGGRGVAIFGDRIVSEGETLGEWTVAQVEPYRVVVRRGAERRTLEMHGPSAGR